MMRNFFINSFEKLVAILLVLISIGVLIAAVGLMVSGQPGGVWMGIAALIGGAFYVVLIGGVLYLALGIHDNTRRTAEAIEKLAARRD
ncbi:MAG: hypothetical protein WDA25_05620 [Paracoccaceae bacterium]